MTRRPATAGEAPVPPLAAEAIPRLRGLLHAWAFWVALAGAIALVALAPGGDARAAIGIYGAGLCALFAFSGLYHRWRWSPRWRPLLRRLDHSTIFVFIAASMTPTAVLVLGGTVGTIVLVSAWVGAVAGVAFSVAWIDAPRLLQAAAYLAVGWVIALAAPQLAARLGVAAVVLIALGGVLYTLGAVVYASRRPDPWPRVFGFHEVFHALVIAAAVVHFVVIAGWVLPAARG